MSEPSSKNPFANDKFRGALYAIFGSLGLVAQVVVRVDSEAVNAILGVINSLLLFLALFNVSEFKDWLNSWRSGGDA